MAEQQPTQPDAMPDHVSVAFIDTDEDWLWLSWEDNNLPLSWQVQCLHGNSKMPGAFLVALIQWICAAERLDGVAGTIRDVELDLPCS